MIDVAASLPSFGLTRKDFERERDRLLSGHGVASAGDVCWAVLNRLQLVADQEYLRTELRLAKAKFMRKEGKDPSPEIARMYQDKVRSFARIGASGIEIMASHCCDECAKLEGKRMTLTAAAKDLPVPNPRCTRVMNDDSFPTCACSIGPVFPEDE
jgi:hypothetical protein